MIMPNEEMNRLALEAEELRALIQAQKQHFEEAISGYQKDRLIREQEFKLKVEDFREKEEQIKTRLALRQETNY